MITAEAAEAANYLSKATLDRMHLMPKGDPIACTIGKDGKPIFYYDPRRVATAPPPIWFEREKMKENLLEPITLESGKVIGRVNVKRAKVLSFFSMETLHEMNCQVVSEPVAYTRRKDGQIVLLYDKLEAVRQPKHCMECGKGVRYRRKLCQACYERDLAARRVQGDAHRAEHCGMVRERVLFFDLELTGVYDHDEILSISIVDGTGRVIMDTLVRPVHTRKWKKTVKIHGITPEMVVDAPTLNDLAPEIREIIAGADVLIAYGIVTDFNHIRKIYATEAEQSALHDKLRCAATEYKRYIDEHYPDLTHTSLSDAMATLGLAWDGVAHTSIADTVACRKVWEALFPHYYEA